MGYCGLVNVQMAQNSLPHFLELNGAYMYAREMLEEDYRDGVGRKFFMWFRRLTMRTIYAMTKKDIEINL